MPHVPGPGPSERYADGSLLIQQVRSSNNRTARQRKSLRTLNLGRVGRSAVCDPSEPSIRGLLESVDFMVAVLPLTLDAADFAPYSDAGGLQPTQTADAGARMFEGAFGEFAEVHAFDEDVAVRWSTALPAATALSRVADAGWLRDDDDVVIVDVRDGRARGTALGPGLEALTDPHRLPGFVQVRRDGAVLTWERPVYPRHVDEDVDPGALAVRTPRDTVDADRLAELIRVTATPETALSADQIAQTAARC